MSPSTTKVLVELLKSLFTTDELYRFATFLPHGNLASALPSAPTSLDAVAFEMVQVLKRHGWIDDAFFTQLEVERPGRKAEITRIRTLILERERVVGTQARRLSSTIARRPSKSESSEHARVVADDDTPPASSSHSEQASAHNELPASKTHHSSTIEPSEHRRVVADDGAVPASQVRVYELAREFNISHKELIANLRDLGINVINHMSSLDADEVARAKRSLKRERVVGTESRQLSSTVLRRPSKSESSAHARVVADDGAIPASQVRVYELAREFNISHEELIADLRALGINVNNHMSSLDADEVARVKSSLKRQRVVGTESRQLSSTVLRRPNKSESLEHPRIVAADGTLPASSSRSEQASGRNELLPAPSPSRVFISYSHDSTKHAWRVFDLANRLRTEGVDAWIDQYEIAPAQGWPRWMQQQLEQADFILFVCTATYRHRFEGREDPGQGKGVTWEGLLAQQVLYEAQTRNERLVPVLFDEEDEEPALPITLRPYTRYRLPSGYEALYRRLTGQPAVIAPPVGPVRPMPLHGPSTPTGVVNDASSGTSNERVAIGPLPTRSTGLPDWPSLASETSGRVPDERILPLEEQSAASVADAGRAKRKSSASLETKDIQHVLVLTRDALQMLEQDGDVRLSVVVQKCIRIARLRNDLDNLWWLRLEMTSLGTRVSHNGPGALKDLDEDAPDYYSSKTFWDKRRTYADAYKRDRSIWGAESLDGSSLPELESNLALLSAEVADSSAELEQVRRMGGMRLKDLRELERVNANHIPQLMERIRNLQAILQRVRHRVYEFLTRTESAIIRQT